MYPKLSLDIWWLSRRLLWLKSIIFFLYQIEGPIKPSWPTSCSGVCSQRTGLSLRGSVGTGPPGQAGSFLLKQAQTWAEIVHLASCFFPSTWFLSGAWRSFESFSVDFSKCTFHGWCLMLALFKNTKGTFVFFTNLPKSVHCNLIST